MKHPFVVALVAGLVVVLAAFAPSFWHALRGDVAVAPSAAQGPWQVRALPGGGIEAMGFALPGATLGDAATRWPDELQLAVMARRGGAGALEAYLESYREGGIAGRLVLAAEVAPEVVAGWQARALRSEPVDGQTFRHTLNPQDRTEALRAPLAGITFIPAAQLDAATVAARFGVAAERWASGERIEQWLYPASGLAVAIDREGRDVLQFVAPADFERRLRAPLVAAGATRLP
jgi:hypothetical protein